MLQAADVAIERRGMSIRPMVTWLRLTDREQRKMLVSIGANFLTRVPGVIGLLWFLPLLHTGIGTSTYADILSALALGGTATFLMGGVVTLSRRMVGEAYANDDPRAEADAFASALVAGLLATVLSTAVVIAYCELQATSTAFLIITTACVVGAYVALADMLWAAYNQQYVAATLLIILQSIGYAVGLTVPAATANAMLGASVILGPYIATSVIATVLLLWKKPYLLKGRPIAVWYVIRHGTMLAMADGFMMATLGIAVVWMQAEASPDASAWFATLVRLFQTLLLPVSLLLLPLSSYIRLLWKHKTLAQQQAYTKLTLGIGLAYGTLVAVAVLFASRLYVGYFLHLPVPGDVAVFLLFGVIVAYRSYSSIVYMVLVKETVHLSLWTTAAMASAMAAGAVGTFFIEDALSVIDLFAIIAAISMTTVLLWSVTRFGSISNGGVAISGVRS